MWNGQIHDPQFVGQILEHLEGNEDKYGTSTRMKGMLTVAKEVGTLCQLLCRLSHRSLRNKGTPCTVLLHAFKGGEFLPLYLSLFKRNSVSEYQS
jgi:tRNA G26 N,N-dimethylase Trm1